jgi:hypothetical protein
VLKLDNNRKTLYQWDVGVIGTLAIDGVDEVHFSNLRYGVSFNIKVVDNKVDFPPEVLQSGADVFCWAFVREENGGYTKKEQTFNVEKRPRPADYVFEPTEILSWETLSKELGVFKEDTAEALADLEKGTIKVFTEKVDIWKLDTGIYYLNGGFSFSETTFIENGEHILIIYKPSLLTEAVRYIHFCNSTNAPKWVPIECGYTNGTSLEIYDILDTSRIANKIESGFYGSKIPTSQMVIDYVNEQLGVIDNGRY